MTKLTGEIYRIFKPGNLWMFDKIIRLTRNLSGQSDELYPAWQGMQYMYNMYSGCAKLPLLDNNRYPVKWTKASEVLGNYLSHP